MGKQTRLLAALLVLLCLAGCAIQTGWITKDGNTLYADEQGKPVIGWQEIEEKTYFFDQNGYMVTGWQEIEGKTYFFDQDGCMVTGWLDEGGETYFLLEDGTPTTGWFIDGEKQFFFSPDGALARGWTEVDGSRLYFGQDGALATGRLELEDGIYLLDETGLPLTGWQDTEFGRAYCLPDGALAQGWTEIDSQRYYFGTNGAMATGYVELEDGGYLLKEDGTAHTGWSTEDGKRYYCYEDGAVAVGQVEIEGETYYFSPHGVQMLLVNPWNYIPKGYKVELEVVEHYIVATECAEALRQMLADCRAAGFKPVICSGYRAQSDQEYLYKNKVRRVMAQGYGEEDAKVIAAKEVAIPGTSEHQLGLAVDILDDDNWVLDEKQAEMPTQKWLMEHCWEYGFILRYPVGSTDITGIIYEPWHYRYVGVEISTELRELNITLEEYLGAANHN